MTPNLNTLVNLQKFTEIKEKFEKGYRLKGADSWSFISSCANGNLDIINLFLKHPDFETQIHLTKIKTVNWNEGYLFACSNNHIDVFKHLKKDPIYSKLGDPCQLIVGAMVDFVHKRNIDILQYLIKELNFHQTRDFYTYYQLLNQDSKSLLEPFIFYKKLQKLPTNNTKSSLNKI